MNGFWNVSLAQIVTWLLIVAGFVSSLYISVKLLSARMDTWEDWRRSHENEAKARDNLLVKLEIATEKLTVLTEVASRRLERLEDRPH